MNPCPECGHPRSYHTMKHSGCRQCGCPMQRYQIPRTKQVPPVVPIVVETRVVHDSLDRILVTLPMDGSWHGNDDERRFLTMTPKVAEDLMHALEWWKDER